jgi:hypothetical protein
VTHIGSRGQNGHFQQGKNHLTSLRVGSIFLGYAMSDLHFAATLAELHAAF